MLWRPLLLLCCVVLLLPPAGATDDPESLSEAISEAARGIARLEAQRDALIAEIESAPPPTRPGLEASLDDIERRLDSAGVRFEELATGGVDLSAFADEAAEFDWRSDVLDTLRSKTSGVSSSTPSSRSVSLRKCASRACKVRTRIGVKPCARPCRPLQPAAG